MSKPENFLELFGKQRAKHSNLDPSDSLIYKKIAKTMIITIMLAFPTEAVFLVKYRMMTKIMLCGTIYLSVNTL